jgi:hypothetical protein
VAAKHQKDFLTADILALQGWAGLLWNMETRGDRVAVPSPPGTLLEFVAVRLILVRLARAYVAQEKLGFKAPIADLFDRDGPPRLVVLTCGGAYDARNGYRDNVVVIAEPDR